MQQARDCFNPCMFNGVIYLCGNNSLIMEAFSPDSDRFLPLNITVPEDHYCCLYVDNDLLVVNSYSYILKYAVAPGGQLVEQSRVNSPAVGKQQNSQPVVDRAQGLYFITLGGQYLRFSMQTGVQGPTS